VLRAGGGVEVCALGMFSSALNTNTVINAVITRAESSMWLLAQLEDINPWNGHTRVVLRANPERDIGTAIAAPPHRRDPPHNMATGFRDRRVNDIAVVRLTHKYAEMIDDVDLSGCQVGETLQLRAHDANLLIAEGWAERVDERRRTHQAPWRAVAADSVEPASRRTEESPKHGSTGTSRRP
jgi:hypothetical protein